MCYNEKNVEFSVGGEFMDSLWSMSTTVRELLLFLFVGYIWYERDFMILDKQ